MADARDEGDHPLAVALDAVDLESGKTIREAVAAPRGTVEDRDARAGREPQPIRSVLGETVDGGAREPVVLGVVAQQIGLGFEGGGDERTEK